MRARSAAALMEDCCTGSAAITTGTAHSAAVPHATIDHLRHAPRRSKLTGPRTSPLLPPDQRTSGPPRCHRRWRSRDAQPAGLDALHTEVAPG